MVQQQGGRRSLGGDRTGAGDTFHSRQHRKGHVARGGYLCSLEWRNGNLYEAKILSPTDTICRLRTNIPIHISGIKGDLNKKVEVNGITTYISVFEVQKDRTYSVRPQKVN